MVTVTQTLPLLTQFGHAENSGKPHFGAESIDLLVLTAKATLLFLLYS